MDALSIEIRANLRLIAAYNIVSNFRISSFTSYKVLYDMCFDDKNSLNSSYRVKY